MEKVYTLEKLVKKYGSKAQKQSLKKNKGNLTGKEFQILLKSVDQEWESYAVEGRGSKRIITCSGKRLKKRERVDKRCNNGQGQLVGEFQLKSLVLNYLIKNDNKVSPMSLTRWITELELVDDKLIGALYGERSRYLENIQEQFSLAIKGYEKADYDNDMLDEFIQITFKSIKSSMLSVFKKLTKSSIIIHQKERWGCTTKNNHRKLKQKEIKEIDRIKNSLLLKHGLKSNDLFKIRAKVVKKFKKEFREELVKQLNLKYDYDAHFCELLDADIGGMNHLDIFIEEGELDFNYRLTDSQSFIMTRVYKDIQSEYSLELATRRENNISNRTDLDGIVLIKIDKHYASMWEVLLRYFRCTSNRNTRLPIVGKPTSTTIKIDGVEVRISNKKINSLGHFEAIRLMSVTSEESRIKTGNSLN